MPKFQVSIARELAKPEILTISADSAEEACWLALSSTGAWKGVEVSAVALCDNLADAKVVKMRSAA